MFKIYTLDITRSSLLNRLTLLVVAYMHKVYSCSSGAHHQLDQMADGVKSLISCDVMIRDKNQSCDSDWDIMGEMCWYLYTQNYYFVNT